MSSYIKFGANCIATVGLFGFLKVKDHEIGSTFQRIHFLNQVQENNYAALEKELAPFFKRVGVRRDVRILDSLESDSGLASCMGVNEKTRNAVISLLPGFYEAEKEGCRFAIKHETAHIIHNDIYSDFLVSLSSSVAAGTLALLSKSSKRVPKVIRIFPAPIALISAVMSFTLYGKYCERRADNFAIRESSVEELQGGRRLFLATMSLAPEKLFDAHPTEKSRVNKIENALMSRGVDVQALRISGVENTAIRNLEKEIDKLRRKHKEKNSLYLDSDILFD